ncbi:TlpA family protein disulfide reductase [Acidobacteriota bacterium]
MKKTLMIFMPIVLILLSSGAIGDEAVSTLAAFGEKSPSFELTGIDGEKISSDDFDGKVVLINFWATWCGPCRQEIPDFIEAYKEMKNKGLVIVGLAVADSENRVKSFVERNKINYPIAMASDDVVQAFSPGEFIPTTIVLDSEGNIIDKHVGTLDKAAIARYLKEFKK